MAWRGDFGYTDLLDQEEIPKHDLRFEVLGTVDEATSVLGLARAQTPNEQTQALILEIQRDLCWMMSELAATTAEARPDIHITEERSDWLANMMDNLQAEAPLEPHFTAPGDGITSSYLQLARAVVRRAERRATLLDQRDGLHNSQIIAYLNRLSALLFALARYEDLTSGVVTPTPARSPG